MKEVQCKVCDAGSLLLAKKYRMSGVVVVIGYILIAPSVLGVLVSAYTLAVMGHVSSSPNESARATEALSLQKYGLPEPVIQRAVEQRLTEKDKAGLSIVQRVAIRYAETAIRDSSAGLGTGSTIAGSIASGFAGGIKIFFGLLSFVGGLLGWLLIMKKQILQCNNCSAVIAAS